MPGSILDFYPLICGNNYNSSSLDDSSVSSDTCRLLGNHHYNQDLESFQQPQKSLMTFWSPFLSPPLDLATADLCSVPTTLPFPELILQTES